MIKLTFDFPLSGVATQGLGLVDEWTTSYRVLFSNKSDEDYREYSETGTFPKVIKFNMLE